jgi:hypothetical protein
MRNETIDKFIWGTNFGVGYLEETWRLVIPQWKNYSLPFEVMAVRTRHVQKEHKAWLFLSVLVRGILGEEKASCNECVELKLLLVSKNTQPANAR